MPAKYYIYSGRRWCEVDTRRGRVSGWRQRARFCFLRGGRLEIARTGPVLRALRALATGAGGAARDAAPLQRRRPRRSRREAEAHAHRCCSQHLHHSRCDLNANELAEKTLPAWSDLATVAASPRKRKRSTSEEPCKAKLSKTETELNKAKQGKPSPQKTNIQKLRDKEKEKLVQSLLQSSEDDKQIQKSQSPQKKKIVKVRSREEAELVKSLLQTSSSEDSKEKPKYWSSEKSKTSAKVQGKEAKKPAHNLQSNSSENAKEQKSQLKLDALEKKVVESLLTTSLGKLTQKTKSPQKPKTVTRDRVKEQQKLKESLLQSSSSEDNVKKQDRSKKKLQKAKPLTDSERSSSPSESSREKPRSGPCKELVISDDDVLALRNFLARGAAGTELERFDEDEEYKTNVFYKLNPLVVLSRCQPLESLLLQRLSLEEFARHLGLRSVADVTPEKRYRMRHSTRRARPVTSDSESEEQPVAPPKRRQLWNRDKELFSSKSSRSSELRDRPVIPKPADRSHNNDSETEVKQHIRRQLERRTSARVKPGEDKQTKSNKTKDNDSVVISDDSDSNADDSGSATDGTREKSPRQTRRSNKINDSVVVSDESGSNTDDNGSNNDGSRMKSMRTRRSNNLNSLVISDESDVNDNRGKYTSRSRAKGQRRANNENKPVVVSDEIDSDTDKSQGKSARRSRTQGPKERVFRQRKSVLISDDTDSDADENRKKIRTNSKASETSRSSDESTNADKNNEKSAKRTRSQGPKKRGLKERNKSVLISDDTDSNADENPETFRTRSKAPEIAKARNKSIVVSDESGSNTDENQGRTRRTRSSDPGRALKEQNSSDSNRKKESDKKTRKDVDNYVEKRPTRSSFKGTDNELKTPAPRKTDNVAKIREYKTNKELVKESKTATTMRDQDKSVISDSDSTFESSKLPQKKNQASDRIIKHKRTFSPADMKRNRKGRFLAKKKEVKDPEKVSEKYRLESENKEKHKAVDKHIIDQEKSAKGNGKRIDKQKTGYNSNDKVKNKVYEKQRTEKERGKGSDTDRTGKKNNEEEKTKVKDKQRIEKKTGNRSDNSRTGSENDNKRKDKRTAVARNMLIKPLKYKKSSVANGREYTSLEDHAIVAWVSTGNRERRVNGNALWRELQLEYTRLTSQTRSWHSLRNRYLRYILPALGALALPPAQVSRLRAAAATGNFKSRKDGRRNSIFNEPRVRSAAAAGRARAPHGLGPEKTPTPPPRTRPPASPSKPPPSPLKQTSSAKPASTSKPTSSSKGRSSKRLRSSSTPPPSPPRATRATPSPSTTRLRARPSATSTPTPVKKRRIHHL